MNRKDQLNLVAALYLNASARKHFVKAGTVIKATAKRLEKVSK